MSKLPNQVYAGLFEIIKDDRLYYHSSVAKDYSHFTEEGQQAVLQWLHLMAPEMRKLEETELDARAKQMLWKELKK